jgi:hypothetical protein
VVTVAEQALELQKQSVPADSGRKLSAGTYAAWNCLGGGVGGGSARKRDPQA